MGRWHADAARRLGADVVAVADPDAEAARALGGEGRAYPDLDALLDALSPEAVHLCTPLGTHGALARQALGAGCHVLVEKPLAASAEETDALLDAAEAVDRLLCPVHQFPFQDGVREVHSRLGALGRLVRLDAVFCSAGADGPDTPGPDAVVADVLPHPISLIQSLLPGALAHAEWTTHHPAPGELLVATSLGDTLVTIRVSMNARPTEAVLRLGGTEGSAHVDLFHGYATTEAGDVSQRRKVTLPFERAVRQLSGAGANLARRAARREPAYPGLRRLISAFYAACDGRQPPPISARAIHEAATVRDALVAQAGLDLTDV